jgi:indole-3-glycerol phosphate synthase
MIITRVSAITGKEHVRDISVNVRDLTEWKMGLGSIQDLMPYLSDTDREFILSGITEDEWSMAFAEA